MRTPAAAAVLALVTALAASGCGGAEDRTLTVLAAASLTDVFEELAEEFEESRDVTVDFSFGSSTDLAEQAADGAPGDVLATADEVSMRLAEDAGVASGAETFASNVLTIVTPAGNPGGVRALDDLADATWVRCADEVPCGRVAVAVLGAAGVTAEPASLEEDVRATLDKVTSGEADAGLVYASDAIAAGDAVTAVEIPGAEEQLTSYLAATLEQAQDDELARAWIEMLRSEEGRAVLADAGFGTP